MLLYLLFYFYLIKEVNIIYKKLQMGHTSFDAIFYIFVYNTLIFYCYEIPLIKCIDLPPYTFLFYLAEISITIISQFAFNIFLDF